MHVMGERCAMKKNGIKGREKYLYFWLLLILNDIFKLS